MSLDLSYIKNCAGCGEEYADFLGEFAWEGKLYCTDRCAGQSTQQKLDRALSELSTTQRERDELKEELADAKKHLDGIKKLDPDWHDSQAAEADAIGEFGGSVEYHDKQRSLLNGLLAGTHEIIPKARVAELEKTLTSAHLWVSTIASVYPGHRRDDGSVEADLAMIENVLKSK